MTPALHSPLMSVTNAISSVIVVGAMLGRRGLAPAAGRWRFGFVAVILACVNIFGGFLVTQRMLAMFKQTAIEARADVRQPRPRSPISIAGVLFILALRGLSSPGHVAPGQPVRHDRHGDRGRSTTLAPSRHAAALGYGLIFLGIVIGGSGRRLSSRCASR